MVVQSSYNIPYIKYVLKYNFVIGIIKNGNIQKGEVMASDTSILRQIVYFANASSVCRSMYKI